MRLNSILFCIAAWPLLIGASEPQRLQPSSQWVVDYADDSCRLIRMFGTGRDETKLVFESLGPSQLTMTATGKPLIAPPNEVNVATRFLPLQQKPFFGGPAKTSNQVSAVTWSAVPMKVDFEYDNHQLESDLLMVTGSAKKPFPKRPLSDAAKVAATKVAHDDFVLKTTALEIKAPEHAAVILETGSLAGPMKAFDQCDRDLLQDIGLDPNVQQSIVRPVWPLISWIDSSSYPMARIAMEQEASVVVRALVDATGKPTACTAVTQYDAPDFKKAVCNSLLKNGRFAPAELADGSKVPSYYVTNVSFRVTS